MSNSRNLVNINLVNIANKKRLIYLFQRINGKKVITADSSFMPYYYEPDKAGKFISIFGDRLTKRFVSDPSIISKVRSKNSWESDIIYYKRYLIDKIKEIDKTKLKIGFIDIEVKARDLPKPDEAKYPISAVTVYNPDNKQLKNWFLPDRKTEKEMLSDLANYLRWQDFDIILGWNVSFDWEFLSNRWRRFYKSYFAINVSTIHTCSFRNKLFTPAGTSIIDYEEMYKKMFPKGIKSYTLDYILEYEFGAGKTHQVEDFNILDENLRHHNIEDTISMAKIEEKHHIVSYFDEIRRVSCCDWSDVLYNSRVIDIILLRQAKEDNIVLPNRGNRQKERFAGADRKSTPGLYKNVKMADLSSAYPSAIYNFKLSPENVGKKGIIINGYSFAQNEGILTKIIKKFGWLKKKYKEMYKKDKSLYDTLQAIKGIYNGFYGVMKFASNRLYSLEVASTTAFLIRDLLYYIEKHNNFKEIFRDTDGIAYQAERDLVDDFNKSTIQWGKEKYGKDIDMSFESERPFKILLNIDDCHYIGMYNDGSYKIRGLEMKRSSSSVYKAWFQETLLKEKIFKGVSYSEIKKWVATEKQRIKTLPLLEIAFPAKVKDTEYKEFLTRNGVRFKKKLPIFIRALRNSKIKERNGQLFYWVYLQEGGIIAIDKKHLIKKDKIDWDKMISVNITNTTNKIFEALGWSEQSKLF